MLLDGNLVSLHDHHIREFCVDVGNKRLRLVTELPGEAGARRAAPIR